MQQKFSILPEAKQAGAMRLEPGLRARRVRRQARDGAPKFGGMDHMQEMCGFVRRKVIEDEMRRQDEAP